MNPNWDLSYLYKGFDDPAFLADLKRFPEEIKVEQAILDGGDDPQTKLEKLTDQQEVLGALSDRLSSFCSLTQAVDANNADATKYLNVLDVIFNDSRIVSSAITRYIGSLANLEDLIAASPKLQKVAFHLRESAENAHHTIPEAVEPWILEMSLSGGSAFASCATSWIPPTRRITVGRRFRCPPCVGLRTTRMPPSVKMPTRQKLLPTRRWSCPCPTA